MIQNRLKLILVRHGESEMNRLGIHQGQLHDVGLSENGIKQARELGKALKYENIKEIYSSDMKRTLQTAKIISEELGGIKIIQDRRLREFTMGDFDKTPEKRDELFNELNMRELAEGKSKYEIRPPNGENIWDLIKRASSFLKDIEKINGKILAVAHGGFNEVLLNVSQGLEKNDFKRYHQDNACINNLIYENNMWKIVSINLSSHIEKTPKPYKEIYQNQEEIRSEIYEKIKVDLLKLEIPEAYIFGSLNNGMFGKYSSTYGRHKGSNVNIFIFSEMEDVPRKWRYISEEEGFWKIYEIGKYKIDDVKHKMDLFIVHPNNREKVERRINEFGWKIEKLI